MKNTDTDTIPATPVYTITIASTGAAMVDGEDITAPGTPHKEARLAALAEVRIKAALHGRPVRAVVKDLDGTALPLVVAVDGTTTTLAHPHPSPFVMVLTDDDSRPCYVVPDVGPPAAPADLLASVAAARAAGDVAEARALAERLGARLAAERGHDHPDSIGMLTVHAWLALSDPETAWSAETLALLLEAAERRLATVADPRTDTTRVILNAHALWHHLRTDDPETALDLAPRLLDLLQDHPRRTRDVITWAAERRVA
ncbi:hypothetical protein ACPXCP_39975 [Streptomyces sp. DT20]|uniref:hypothetical protein n=1 Tax=Streptomyces sp. DT20 TaxID=3416519 RepID=UPI003CF80453